MSFSFSPAIILVEQALSVKKSLPNQKEEVGNLKPTMLKKVGEYAIISGVAFIVICVVSFVILNLSIEKKRVQKAIKIHDYVPKKGDIIVRKGNL
jgi:hypothetical protein